MATRIVEWKKPYTWWKAITVDENKVISLNLRDENNLIIYDEWDDEIYVDLQLPDNIRPTDAFPVWVTTGRVLVADDRSVTGTIVVFKTTNWGIIKLLYEDADIENDTPWRLFIDNWTDGFRQIYFKSDVDEIVSRLQAQIDVLYSLWKFLSLWDCVEWEPMSFPLTIPYEYSTWDYYLIWNVSSDPQVDNLRPEWSEWDDTASQTVETQVVEIWDVYIYDGTTWLLQKNKLSEWSTIEYVTQDEYNNLPDSKNADGKHYFIYSFSIIHVTWVTLNESTISLTTVWDTYQLTATVSPNDATDKSVTWSSSNQSVATVDNNWLVTCVTPWNATITVTTTDGNYTATCGVDAWWWHPWAYTVAYYPLDSTNTVNDLSWNNYTLTNSGVTFWTYQWVDCAVSSWSNQLYSTIAAIPSWAAPRTLSVWVYISSSSSGLEYNTVWYWENSNHKSYQIYQAWQSLFSIRTYYDDANVSWDNNWYQHWINIIATYDGNVNTLYINGNSEVTSTVTLNTTASDLYIGASPFVAYWTIWYISEVILENKAWTVGEVEAYFDATKWNYWIS